MEGRGFARLRRLAREFPPFAAAGAATRATARCGMVAPMPVRRLVLVPLLLSLACDRPGETQAPPTAKPAEPAVTAPAPIQRPTLVARDPIGAGVLASIDTTVDPCTDFYKYACGGWLKKTKRPEDKPRYGRGFGELADRNNAVLRTILETAASAKGKQGPVESRLGAFWNACMDE